MPATAGRKCVSLRDHCQSDQPERFQNAISLQALEHLARLDPKRSERGKRAQIKLALREVANELANTPAVCKRSYVHALVIEAFETGRLRKLASNGHSDGRNSGHRLLRKILRSASAIRV
jgi:DNA topoisomerase I